jgi:hypothetical protein
MDINEKENIACWCMPLVNKLAAHTCMKDMEFLDKLNNHHLLKKESLH